MNMEVQIASTSFGRSLLHPTDAERTARQVHYDDIDRSRSVSEDARPVGQITLEAAFGDSPPREDDQGTTSSTRTLTTDETTELFRTKLEDARKDTENALAGSEAVSGAVKLKLTLDLGHSNLQRLPDGVVDLIKSEVERLSLSHNQIWFLPLRMADCTLLRYLNLRANILKDIPRGVYKLPFLEILDVSRNKIKKIEKAIKNLSSLRVLSLTHNRIDDLPREICDMTKLQVMKVAENPLRLNLKKIVEAKEAEVAYSEMTENERDAAVTLDIKRHLRESNEAAPPTPMDMDFMGDNLEAPIETPRPARRVISSRFPVMLSTTSVDATNDFEGSSPSQNGAPPIPTRSHHRMASGISITPRRPGIAPLISANSERNRSNSESVLQASAAARSKRMGMFKKARPDLDSIEESKVNRNSHLRGYSHASVLKSRQASLSSPRADSASPGSPRDPHRSRPTFVKRLSCLPEHKPGSVARISIVEGAKGLLYALYQVHPHISGLIASIKGKESKRSSLEMTFFSASAYIDKLNEAIEIAHAIEPGNHESTEKVEDAVQRDCETCVMVYLHVIAQLRRNVRKIVGESDSRYVRTLMLLLYGSMIEIRNAVSSFGVVVQGHRRNLSSGNKHTIQTIPEEFTTPQQNHRNATPSRERTLPATRGGRFRSDTTIQHPVFEKLSMSHHQPVLPPHTAPLPPAMHLTGTTISGSLSSIVNSAYSNGTTLASSNGHGLRSRSSSRTGRHMLSSGYSSIASTPRSGEGFNLPSAGAYPTRINPLTNMTDAQEETIFEQIFLSLTRAYDTALQAVPIAKKHFVRCLKVAEDNRQPKEIRELWSTLIYRCRLCEDVTGALQLRLVNMHLKEPGSGLLSMGHGRNESSFWALCKTFLQTFVDLVTEMREAKDLRLLPQEVVALLRPVQKASREAGKLIDTSPWKYMADGGGGVPVGSPFSSISSVPPILTNGTHAYTPTYPSALAQQQPSQSPFPPPLIPIPPVPASGPPLSSQSINGISPVSVPLPATPLSAALGPAAQATVPSATVATTPATTYGDQFFRGDVFQRAEQLLSMPQASGVSFFNRR